MLSVYEMAVMVMLVAVISAAVARWMFKPKYSLLSAKRLRQLIEEGVIQGVDPKQVNAASIDVRLGDFIMYEKKPSEYEFVITLRDRKPLNMVSWAIDDQNGYILRPGEFILASTIEMFNLPDNISAQFQLKSSGARIGLEHLKAGWCDAGWHGSVLTLELLNVTQYHGIRLYPGDLIGQIVFFEHEPVSKEHSYATLGSYNKDATVSGAKAK